MMSTDFPLLSGDRLITTITQAVQALPTALSQPLSHDHLFACVTRFAHRIAQGEFDLPFGPGQRDELLSYCRPDVLRQKVLHELGDTPFQLRRFTYRDARFEAWAPLGCVLHVTPSNAPLLPFLATLESLLAGNVNWVRPSTSDPLSAAVLKAFTECDDSGVLSRRIVSWPIDSADVHQLLPHVDGMSAWGGDEALSSLREKLKPGCRWIPWGHKISFAYVTPDAMQSAAADAIFDGIADAICRQNQQACSSPQLVLVDSEVPATLAHAGDMLAAALTRRADKWPAIDIGTSQAADIQMAVSHALAEQAFEQQLGNIWKGEGWRVIWKHLVALDASPLFRTVLLRPMPRSRLASALQPWRGYLQTCGLACEQMELATLCEQLIDAGVGRISQPEHMHDGYIGEPHDNERALTRFARRVSVSPATTMVAGRAVLSSAAATPVIAEAPVMGREAFMQAGHNNSARLFFRSGGTSTGTPVLAAFSYRDYHLQMRAAADGLFAAGLDPSSDRIINLLYAGNLYGGLLSSFVSLDKLDAVHYPMAQGADDNHDEVADLIATQGIDTIIGMPSTVHLLFRRAEARLRAYGGIRKVFLGGEHLTVAQRDYIAGFGVTLIRSAIYGSNDAGPLGHACAHSEDGVFHLLSDVQALEIVGEDADRPVPAGEVGRLLFTSLARDAQDIRRYDIGDLGCLIVGACACGLPAPRFRLLGRHGQLHRVGTMMLNLPKLKETIDMPVQFHIESHEGVDLLVVCVDGDPALARRRLMEVSSVAQIVSQGLALLEVVRGDQFAFAHHSRSGKAALVLDSRRASSSHQ